MNIEETSIIDALLDGGDLIRHIHCLDNNRLGVGMGRLDFKTIFKVLKRMNYSGYLTVESCPPKYDPKSIASVAIRNMRELEQSIDSERKGFLSWER
jgi:sugar phosphate isomerase/epimerase